MIGNCVFVGTRNVPFSAPLEDIHVLPIALHKGVLGTRFTHKPQSAMSASCCESWYFCSSVTVTSLTDVISSGYSAICVDVHVDCTVDNSFRLKDNVDAANNGN